MSAPGTMHSRRMVARVADFVRIVAAVFVAPKTPSILPEPVGMGTNGVDGSVNYCFCFGAQLPN